MGKRIIPKIIVVDRDATACLLMREICQSAGWDVVGCSQDVNDAMMMMAQTRPHCLVSGYKFNGTATGLHLIHHARRLLPELFTMIYTGWDINDVAANIMTQSPDRILRKPMPQHLLLDLLDGVQARVIRSARLRERDEATMVTEAEPAPRAQAG